MDECTLVGHEIMHVLVRRNHNNIDLSTPDIFPSPQPSANLMESGRLFELALFSALPDWMRAGTQQL